MKLQLKHLAFCSWCAIFCLLESFSHDHSPVARGGVVAFKRQIFIDFGAGKLYIMLSVTHLWTCIKKVDTINVLMIAQMEG